MAAPDKTPAEIATAALATASYRGWIAYVAGGEARIRATLAAAEAAEAAERAASETPPVEPVELSAAELHALADEIAGGR